jgi:hypothetical protein
MRLITDITIIDVIKELAVKVINIVNRAKKDFSNG